MEKITPENLEGLYYFMWEYQAENGYPPTFRVMSAFMNSSTSTISTMLKQLETEGLIKLPPPGKKRAIRILDRLRTTPTFKRTAAHSSQRIYSNVHSPLIMCDVAELIANYKSLMKITIDQPLLPIPVESIANICLDYSVEKRMLPSSISSVLLEEEKIIVINSLENNRFRNRFSIGHEIGHLRLLRNSIASNNIEQEADCYASYLLMPPNIFCSHVISILKNSKDTNSLVKRISEIFEVSPPAVYRHLREFQDIWQGVVN